MKRDLESGSAISLQGWLTRAAASIAIGAILGGVCLPLLHYLAFGNTDPFAPGWPVCLQVSSFVSAFMISLLLRNPIAAMLGIYLGLTGFMLMGGNAEYPTASAIGLAIHALLPAALGSALSFGLIHPIKRPPVDLKSGKHSGRFGYPSQAPDWEI